MYLNCSGFESMYTSQQLHELQLHMLGFLQSMLITLDEVNQTAATDVRLQGF